MMSYHLIPYVSRLIFFGYPTVPYFLLSGVSVKSGQNQILGMVVLQLIR